MNDKEKLEILPISNKNIDMEYMIIDSQNKSKTIVPMFIYMFILFVPLLINFYIPDKIKILSSEYDNFDSILDSRVSHFLNFHGFNNQSNFYFLSINVFSENFVPFNINISSEVIQYSNNQKVVSRKENNRIITTNSSIPVSVASGYIHNSENIGIRLSIFNSSFPISNIQCFIEISTSESLVFESRLKKFAIILLVYFSFKLYIKMSHSGVVCPEQFITLLFLYAQSFISFPINDMRNIFSGIFPNIIDGIFGKISSATNFLTLCWLMTTYMGNNRTQQCKQREYIIYVSGLMFVAVTIVEEIYCNFREDVILIQPFSFFFITILIFVSISYMLLVERQHFEQKQKLMHIQKHS